MNNDEKKISIKIPLNDAILLSPILATLGRANCEQHIAGPMLRELSERIDEKMEAFSTDEIEEAQKQGAARMKSAIKVFLLSALFEEGE